MYNLVCKQCGINFVRIWPKKYCSRKCYWRSIEKSQLIDCMCKFCYKKFQQRQRDIVNGGRGKYCSIKCYNSDKKNRLGNQSPNWRGGKHKTQRGYILIKDWNSQSKDIRGYIPEHRLVMEKHLGRRLKRNELVHHINHIKIDNRLENLMLLSPSEHVRLHKPRLKKL